MVPLLAPFQKRSLFPLQFGQEESISGNSIERRVYWFIWKLACAHCSHRQSRNRMMNTFIIVKIATSLENSLENKSMLLVHFKKDLPLTLLGNSFDGKAAYWLLFCFELPWYPLFLHRQSKQRTVNTLLMIRTILNWLLIFIWQEKKTEAWLVSPISR